MDRRPQQTMFLRQIMPSALGNRLKILLLAAATVFLAACEHFDNVTISSNRKGYAPTTEVQSVLDPCLASLGFHRTELRLQHQEQEQFEKQDNVVSHWLGEQIKKENREIVAEWTRRDEYFDFWWGRGSVQVKERLKQDRVVVHVTQCGGKPAVDSVAEEVAKQLRTSFPDYSVKLRSYTYPNLAWGK